MNTTLLAQNAGLVLGLMTVLWGVSVVKRDVSIVDPWWSAAFLLVTAHTAFATGLTPAKWLLLAVVGAWALRLWLHLLLRQRGQPEDARYAAFRERFGPARYPWFSFFQVFLLQGALVVVISAPLQIAASASGPIDLPRVLGLVVFGIGFAIEVAADEHLRAFRKNRARGQAVLDTGLWRLSRHPNYFGEAVLWWGFWLFAVSEPYGLSSVFAPAIMTFLLVKVSGVALLDAHLSATKPGYRAYVQRTSSFVLRRPKTDA